MDVSGNTLLAHAGLPLDKHHGIQKGGPSHHPEDIQNSGVLGHQLRGAEELLPDDGNLRLIAFVDEPVLLQGFLQGGQLGDIPNIGDHQDDIVLPIKDGGAGHHRPPTSAEGLLDGDGRALFHGHKGGGLGDDACLHQPLHGDAHHIGGSEAGDHFIRAVDPDGDSLGVRDEDAVKGAL